MTPARDLVNPIVQRSDHCHRHLHTENVLDCAPSPEVRRVACPCEAKARSLGPFSRPKGVGIQHAGVAEVDPNQSCARGRPSNQRFNFNRQARCQIHRRPDHKVNTERAVGGRSPC